ncbi:uncharacterized protein LOC135686004 [Rhopilema esculentum]|uniref:uncharacterized protein LOC135686004 n=1 Tax=Rhopilema esculentum TaxID=499914 RepID=UPI0031D0A565
MDDNHPFEVPNWIDIDSNQEVIAQKVFCQIPKPPRKRKKDNIVLEDVNNTTYLDELMLPEDPNERLKCLLSKLQNKNKNITCNKGNKKESKVLKDGIKKKTTTSTLEVNGSVSEKPQRKKKKKRLAKKCSLINAESMEQNNDCDSMLPIAKRKELPEKLANKEEGKPDFPAVTRDQPTVKRIKSASSISSTISAENGLDFSAKEKLTGKRDFKSKLKCKLSGAQFRWLNEQLYTKESKDAFEMFSQDPALFDIYHHGFQSQVKSWPQNPNDLMIKYLNERPAELLVADLGCGEAKIAQSVKQKVYSFDLVAQNEYVTACDMSKVPLGNETVDVVVFCLSLMGKNIVDFLKEGNRILKQGGVLKIAEVTSRFLDIQEFVKDICDLGFKCVSKDCSNKMFVLMEFMKVRKSKSKTHLNIRLKPCIYKRR